MAKEEQADDGASPRELVLEACRRNNTELLQEVIDDISKRIKSKQASKEVAHLLNNTTDAIGNYCLHVAVMNGSYEVLDMLLDQEGLEVDPLDRMEKETPLHKAVRFANELPKQEWGSGNAMVELLIDAGADTRIYNKAKMKPMNLVDPANSDLRLILQKAEYAIMAGDDIVNGDDESNGKGGSASDSD